MKSFPVLSRNARDLKRNIRECRHIFAEKTASRFDINNINLKLYIFNVLNQQDHKSRKVDQKGRKSCIAFFILEHFIEAAFHRVIALYYRYRITSNGILHASTMVGIPDKAVNSTFNGHSFIRFRSRLKRICELCILQAISSFFCADITSWHYILIINNYTI